MSADTIILLPTILLPLAVLAIYITLNLDKFKTRFKRIRKELEEQALTRQTLFSMPGTEKNTEFKLYRLGFSFSYRYFLVANGLFGLTLTVLCTILLNNIKLGAVAFAVWLAVAHILVDMFYEKNIKEKMAQQAELMLQLLAEVYQLSDNLFDAFAQVVHSVKSPLREEMELLIKDYRLGKDFNACLMEFADRTDNKDIEVFVQGVVVSTHFGTDTHTVLTQIADIIRERRALKEELSNEIKGKSFTVDIFLLGLPLLLAGLLYKSPEARDVFLNSSKGHNLLSLALIIEFVGWHFTRRKGAIDRL